uniref:Uncharacterized protein n=1 Tax=Oryza glumipatula TaxID=40148 RepID=A0A0E0AFW4_9ORYZ
MTGEKKRWNQGAAAMAMATAALARAMRGGSGAGAGLAAGELLSKAPATRASSLPAMTTGRGEGDAVTCCEDDKEWIRRPRCGSGRFLHQANGAATITNEMSCCCSWLA